MYSFGFRKHPCSRKSSVRDYFSQRESIPARRNLPSGIIFPRRMHPCSRKSPVRDYFSQRESIPAQRNLPSGIIFPRRMHPCSKKSLFRDYFPKAKVSLFGEIHRQGLFSRGECILIRKNSLPEIIFPRRMHPYSENFAAKDYCSMENASLTSYFVESGCIPPSKCIPDRVFHQIRMHSSGK